MQVMYVLRNLEDTILLLYENGDATTAVYRSDTPDPKRTRY